MKAVFLSAVACLSLNAFAGQVTPKAFGVQYLAESIADKPFVSYNLTIAASDFPTATFSTLSARLVENGTGKQLIGPRVVYSKSPGTVIMGSDVLVFSFEGSEALNNLKNLKKSSLVFDANDGSSFSIDIAKLCSTRPDGFMNLNGGHGCDVDVQAIDKALKQQQRQNNPAAVGVCNGIQELKPLIEAFCSPDMGNIREQVESQYACKFQCK